MSSAWPQDFRDAVFLGRATQEIGTAMFGPEWTGKELEAGVLKTIAMPTGMGQLSTMDLHRVHWLLHVHRPERGLPPPPKVAATRAPAPTPSIASIHRGLGRATTAPIETNPQYVPFTPTDDDIAEAVSLISELNEKNAPALARRDAVINEIVRGCEAGELAACYLDASNGRLNPTPVEWWRGPNARDRFDQWKIDFKNAFKPLY